MTERELKLQAYLDNVLPADEAREVANWLARDRDAVALVQTLRATRQALAGFEKEVRLPESREFYWSKIRRQIEQLEIESPQPVAVPWFAQLRRFLVPASGLALLLVAAMVATSNFTGPAGSAGETALVDSRAFTYRDYDAGATLVWLSYPADRESQGIGDQGS